MLTDESLTSLAKLVPDIVDYSDNNELIDFSQEINEQLYHLFDIKQNLQKYIRGVLSTKHN